MKRIAPVIVLMLFCLLMPFGLLGASLVQYSNLRVTQLAETADGLNCVTIEWDTSSLQDSIVHVMQGASEISVIDTTLSTHHKVTVDRLAGGPLYQYYVTCHGSSAEAPGQSEIRELVIPSAPARGSESYYNIVGFGPVGVNTGNGNLVAGQTELTLPGTGPAVASGWYYNHNAAVHPAFDAPPFLSDGFELQNLSAWSSSTGWSLVSSARSGALAAQATGTYFLKKNFDGPKTKCFFSGYFKFGETDQYHYPFFPHGDGGTLYAVVAMDNGKFGYYDGTQYQSYPVSMTYSADTWYRVELAFDGYAQRFQVCINGVDVTNGGLSAGFYKGGPATALTDISLLATAGGGTGTMTADDIVISFPGSDSAFVDGMESQTFTSWTSAVGWDAVATPHSGSYAAGGTGTEFLKKSFGGEKSKFYVSGYFRFGENSQNHNPIWPFNSSNESLYGVIAKSDGHFGYADQSGRHNFPIDRTYVANIWYRIEFIFNGDCQRFQVKIDGVDVTNGGLPTEKSAGGLLTSANCVLMQPGDPSGNMLVDDVVISYSIPQASSVLGAGFRLAYSSTLAFDRFGQPVRTDDDGSVHVYTKDSMGGYNGPAGDFTTLKKVSDTVWVVRSKAGTQYTFTQMAGMHRLTQIEDRAHWAIAINRDPGSGRAVSVSRTGSADPVLFFGYDLNGYLSYAETCKDPATNLKYRVDYAVCDYGTWSELRSTDVYVAGTSARRWTTYHMERAGDANPGAEAYVTNPIGQKVVHIGFSADHSRVGQIIRDVSYFDRGRDFVTGSSRAYTKYSISYNDPCTCIRQSGKAFYSAEESGWTRNFIHNPDLSLMSEETIGTKDPISGNIQTTLAYQEYSYNGQRQVIETRSAKGSKADLVKTQYEYDIQGNLNGTSEDFGGSDSQTGSTRTVLQYGSRTDPHDGSAAFEVTTGIIDPRQNSFAYTYDTKGRLTAIDPPASANYRIVLSYKDDDLDCADPEDFLVATKSIVNTDSTTRNRVPNQEYHYGYDQWGRVEAVVCDIGGVHTLVQFVQRDLLGNVIYRVDANCTKMGCTFNDNCQVASVLRPQKLDTTTQSYINGRLAIMASGVTLNAETLASEFPDPSPSYSTITTYTYDGCGRLLTQADAKGRTTTNTYDELDRLIKVTTTENGTSWYRYDFWGNLIFKQYPVSGGYAIVDHLYDGLGREVGSKDPATSCQYEFIAEYDMAGNALTVYRGFNGSNDYTAKILNSYDNLNRCRTTSTYAGPSDAGKCTTFSYDRNGNMVRVEGPIYGPAQTNKGMYTRIMQYDSVNRLVDEIQSSSTDSRLDGHQVFSYRGGKLYQEIQKPNTASSIATDYTFDTAGRLTNIANCGRNYTFTYYPNGSRRALLYGGRLSARYKYDRSYRLTSLGYSWVGTWSGYGKYLTYEYGHDVDGRVTWDRQTNSGNFWDNSVVNSASGATASYSYDLKGQLVNSTFSRIDRNCGESQFSWIYDSTGNRISETRQDRDDIYPELCRDSSKSYAISPLNGNRIQSSISRINGKDQTWTYTYDRLGSLIQRTTVDPEYAGSGWGSETIQSSEFDPFGRVVSQYSKTSTEYWDGEAKALQVRESRDDSYLDGTGQLLLKEISGTDTSIERYVRFRSNYYFYGSGGVSKIISVDRDNRSETHSFVRANGQLLASNDGYFYIVNARGDITGLVSAGNTSYAEGVMAQYYVYDAYGNIRASGSAANETGIYPFNPFGYAGGEQSSNGSYSFGARVYSPSDGRWISQDAYRGDMGDPLSLNRYAYCGNDPVNFVDPSGYKQQCPIDPPGYHPGIPGSNPDSTVVTQNDDGTTTTYSWNHISQAEADTINEVNNFGISPSVGVGTAAIDLSGGLAKFIKWLAGTEEPILAPGLLIHEVDKMTWGNPVELRAGDKVVYTETTHVVSGGGRQFTYSVYSIDYYTTNGKHWRSVLTLGYGLSTVQNPWTGVDLSPK